MAKINSGGTNLTGMTNQDHHITNQTIPIDKTAHVSQDVVTRGDTKGSSIINKIDSGPLKNAGHNIMKAIERGSSDVNIDQNKFQGVPSSIHRAQPPGQGYVTDGYTKKATMHKYQGMIPQSMATRSE